QLGSVRGRREAYVRSGPNSKAALDGPAEPPSDPLRRPQPAQSSSRSSGQLLTIRSAGTPRRSARSQPYAWKSSWPGACASVLIANRHPVSIASLSRSSGGSLRSGRLLISTAVLLSTHAVNTALA